jgi:hypothetical protein
MVHCLSRPLKWSRTRTPERWQSGRMRRFAKPLYGLTPVPRVRIPPSPPSSLNCKGFSLALLRNTRIMPVFRDYSEANRTAENGLLVGEGATVPLFLRRAPTQSGFNKCIRRMQGDQKAYRLDIASGDIPSREVKPILVFPIRRVHLLKRTKPALIKPQSASPQTVRAQWI